MFNHVTGAQKERKERREGRRKQKKREGEKKGGKEGEERKEGGEEGGEEGGRERGGRVIHLFCVWWEEGSSIGKKKKSYNLLPSSSGSPDKNTPQKNSAPLVICKFHGKVLPLFEVSLSSETSGPLMMSLHLNLY